MDTLQVQNPLTTLTANVITARFDLGGALPFKWKLFLYGDGPRKTLDQGDDDSPAVVLGSLASLKGKTLCWSIAAIDFDDDPVAANVSILFADQGQHQIVLSLGTWTVTGTDLLGFANVVVK